MSMSSIYSVSKAPPKSDAELRINGLSLVFYDFYVLSQNKRPSASDVPLEVIECPNHYNLLFDFDEDEKATYDILSYKQSLTIAPLELPHSGIARGTARLTFQLVGEQFLLAITVVNVDRSGNVIDGPKLNVGTCIRTGDVLTLINELNQHEGSLFSTLAGQRDQAVRTCFGGSTVPTNASASRKITAIQIWDIDNLELAPSTRVNGIELSYRFAWEISTLLQCNSDLMRIHRAWRKRRPDQVEELLRQGSDVLADHRVLTNRSVCLEISQVTHPALTVRSAQRLALFGYDSTSIYLWSYLTLQEFVLGYYSKHLSTLLSQASRSFDKTRIELLGEKAPRTTASEVLINLVNTKTAIYHALDNVCWITERMRERRHSKFFTESATTRGLNILLDEVERKLRELTSVATDVYQVFLMLDQRDIMADLRSLNQATIRTKRGIDFLSFTVAAVQAAALSDYIGKLVPVLDAPLWKGLIGLGLFSIAILLYAILSRSKADHTRR